MPRMEVPEATLLALLKTMRPGLCTACLGTGTVYQSVPTVIDGNQVDITEEAVPCGLCNGEGS